MKKTAVHDRHVSLGGKMVEFAGFEMPVQYKGIIKEHVAVRKGVGLFDVSHMGDFLITGDKAQEFLMNILTNNVEKADNGSCVYTHILGEDGMIIDDMILTKFNDKEFFAVPNAAMIDVDFKWFQDHNPGAVLEDLSDNYACFALQGPMAEKTLQKISDHDLSTVKFFKGCVMNVANGRIGNEADNWDIELGGQILITRTGYTGEDGFELIMENANAPAIWDAVVEAGKEFEIEAIGLGARDTLRLEKGFLLSGTDFNYNRTSLETGWDFVIDWEHEFIGKAVLTKQKEGAYQKLTGLIMDDKGVPRHESEVYKDGEVVGTVTSGTMSPLLKKGIAMLYLDKKDRDPGTKVEVSIHGKMLPATITRPPFVKEEK